MMQSLYLMRFSQSNTNFSSSVFGYDEQDMDETEKEAASFLRIPNLSNITSPKEKKCFTLNALDLTGGCHSKSVIILVVVSFSQSTLILSVCLVLPVEF